MNLKSSFCDWDGGGKKRVVETGSMVVKRLGNSMEDVAGSWF